MDTNRIKNKPGFLALFLLMIPGAMLFGQTLQRLSWEAMDFAGSYEVVVEAQSDDTYNEIIRQRLEDPFIDCSLQPGQYRYQVQAFNILGVGGEVSEWTSFEVQPAYTEDSLFIHRLSWESDELAHTYEAVLELLDGDDYRELMRVRERNTFVEVSLPPGSYRFMVQSQDILGRAGESSDWEYFEVLGSPKNKTKNKVLTVQTGALYSPLAPLPFSAFNESFDNKFQPAGGMLKLALFYKLNEENNLGLEFSPAFNSLSAKKEDHNSSAQIIALHLNFIYQYRFPNLPLALNARAGGGVTLINNFHVEYPGTGEERDLSTWIPSIGAGLSLQWFAYRSFYLDLGLEYIQIFSVDNKLLNYIRPVLGIGFAF